MIGEIIKEIQTALRHELYIPALVSYINST